MQGEGGNLCLSYELRGPMYTGVPARVYFQESMRNNKQHYQVLTYHIIWIKH